MPAALKDTNLFKPIKVGSVELANRLVFAPTTRKRASTDCGATDSMRDQYALRAINNGGLLITEGTAIASRWDYFPTMPRLSNEKDAEGWRQVVEVIHKSGSFVSLQVAASGRTARPQVFKEMGFTYAAPSPIYIDEASKKAALECGNPLKELTKDELHDIKKDFVNTAEKAIKECKFDFVELHAAHMYLLNQFLEEVSNQRSDEYGGSIENRARFVLEVVDAVVEVVGAEHVAIRLSPYSRWQGGQSVDAPINPAVNYGYILSELERRAKEGKRLAYVSFVEPRMSAGHTTAEEQEINTGWVTEIWKGPLIRSGNILHGGDEYETLRKFVNADDRTLIGASRFFTSNPDLPNRLKNGYPLTPYDRPTFYAPYTNEGYLTWTKYGEEKTFDDIKDHVPKPLA